jgi:hypothetical protein
MLFVFVIRGAFQSLRGDPQQLDPTHDLRLGAIAGSIGPDVLRRYAVEVDYAHRTIAFTPLAGFRVPAGVLALPIECAASLKSTFAHLKGCCSHRLRVALLSCGAMAANGL